MELVLDQIRRPGVPAPPEPIPNIMALRSDAILTSDRNRRPFLKKHSGPFPTLSREWLFVDPRIEILHEDDGLLVLNKPADLVCHPTKGDIYSSLVSRVRIYLGESSELHLINRLDRETSGVILIAKRLEVARAWRHAWETGQVRKEYIAIVHGHPSVDQGSIDAPLGKDVGSIVAIKDCVRADGAPSITDYRVDRRFFRSGQPFALVAVFPRSGRKHQIRIHLAHLGFPIVGDKIYGPDELFYLAFVEGRLTEDQRQRLILPNHALHAGELHALCSGQAWSFKAPEPEMFRRFCSEAETQAT